MPPPCRLAPLPPRRRPGPAWLWFSLAAVLTAPGRADEFDTLRLKWADMLTGGSRITLSDARTATVVTSLTTTASTHWTSLEKSPARTHLWADAASTTNSAHLSTNFSRLRAMALAYATPGSTLQGNPALRTDVLAGLDWMYANRYNETKALYDNWWDWEIGSPKLLVDTAVLLYADLSPAQLAAILRAVEKFVPSATTRAPGGSGGTFTGANRMDKIYVVAIRGLLAKDDAKLRAARDACSELFLYVNSGDGFYVDGSFIQHNRHPYTGSYGAALMSAMAPILALLNGPNADSAAGSTWRVTDPNLAHVFRWIHESFEPVIYRGGMMAMLQGRAISRNSTSEHGLGHGIMLNILRLSELAPAAERARLRSLLRGWAEADTSRSSRHVRPAAAARRRAATPHRPRRHAARRAPWQLRLRQHGSHRPPRPRLRRRAQPVVSRASTRTRASTPRTSAAGTPATACSISTTATSPTTATPTGRP
jgi:hyaluronate lyase